MSLRRSILAVSAILFLVVRGSAEEWTTHQTNMKFHDQRIAELSGGLSELIDKKRHIKDPKQLKLIMEEMVKNHGLMKEQYEKRNTELNHMRFRHPEQGQEFERKYQRTDSLKALEEYEAETQGGLEYQLSKIREKIRLHFGTSSREVETQQPQKAPPPEEQEAPIHLIK